MRFLPILLLAGCVTETVSLDVKLDTTACTAQQEISRVEAYVLRVGASSLCTLERGSAAGSSGAVTLKPGSIDDAEVVVLALAYGQETGCDGSSCADALTYCGDKTCGAGEDCQSCPHDCGQCTDFGPPKGCGDTVCDASMGEDCQSCPKDCGQCNTGPNSGQLCDQNQPCPQGDSCVMWSSNNTYGMCVAPCQSASVQCPSPIPGAISTCALTDSSGGLYCVYLCEAQGQSYDCPKGLTCVAEPSVNAKICVPSGSCGDNTCDPATEDCKSCPQDCGQCQADAGQAGFGLTPCARCYGLARIELGEQGGSQTVVLSPTAACAVPGEALSSLGLPSVALPPGDCP